MPAQTRRLTRHRKEHIPWEIDPRWDPDTTVVQRRSDSVSERCRVQYNDGEVRLWWRERYCGQVRSRWEELE